MKIPMFFSTLVICTAALWSLEAANDTMQDRSTYVAFPTEVSFEQDGNNYHLDATGVTTRKKFFVKVYSVAHYMEEPVKGDRSAAFQEVLNGNQAKQLTIHWLRPIDGRKIQEAFSEALGQTMNRRQFSESKELIDTFTEFFEEGATKKDEHIIRWLPQGTLVVEINGKERGKIEDPAFAQAVWEIWLGPKSIVNRNQLVERTTSH